MKCSLFVIISRMMRMLRLYSRGHKKIRMILESQRKVNVLAREYCDDTKRKNKPIILSHHMLPGLKKGQDNMSKSDPSSAIFMEDEEV
ncbi:putative tyrosine--tRNA ligase [Helianthus annuus]|uniref:tyrosine--tRNA ligase n=2 Tax=Helianthus annuus TaxID=4232 RepID=A0A9K3IX20_HELAN|nr:putative tyrosine--tRNA ligase [Helianthus annuus]KAJ0745980.1 putative tyrosine--tRNA ligase [Helianthus annuus]